MATTKKVLEIEIDVDTGEVKKLNKELDKTAKNQRGVEKGSHGSARGFQAMGGALKALGIGAIIALFAKLAEALQNNQKVIDFLTTASNALGIAFNDLFKFIGDSVEPVTKWFKELFDDPGKKLQEIADTIRDYVVKQVNQLIEGFGKLGRAIGFLLDGEFAKAWEAAKEGALEAGEAMLKLNPATAIMYELAEAVVENADAIADYAKNTWNAAAATTELNKEAELAVIRQQGLKEEYDRQAEVLRQIRDDETKLIEERIAANEELGRVLKEQNKVELAQIDITERALRNKMNNGLIPEFEAQKQLLELQNQRAEVAARVTGFESEQLINRNALLREAFDKQVEFDELEIELMKEGIERELAANAFKYDQMYLQAEGNAEAQKRIVEAQERDTQAIYDKYAKEQLEKEKALQEAKRSLQSETAAQAGDLLVSLSGLADSESRRGFRIQKAAAISNAIIQGVLGVQAAFSSNAANVGATATSFGAWPFIQAALAAGFAAVNVAAIARTRYSAGGGAASAQSSRPARPNSVVFNTVGNSAPNQIAQSINQQNEPIKAYVVAKDVTNAQEADRNRVNQASFG